MSRWHGPQTKGASREHRTRRAEAAAARAEQGRAAAEAAVLADRAPELGALRARLTRTPAPPPSAADLMRRVAGQ